MTNVSSSNGLEKCPRLRFPGFTSNWKQGKLDDVSTIIGGYAWKSSNYNEKGEFLVVTIANVNGEYYINDTIGNRINTESSNPYILKENDILISLTGNVGRVSKCTNTPAVLNQRVGKLASKNINEDFLFHIVHNINFEISMITSGQGAAQKNISNNDVMKYLFYFPLDRDEQIKIASFLDKIQLRIEKQRILITLLKKYKRGVTAKLITAIEEKYPVVKLGNRVAVMRGGSPRPIDAYITNAENGIRWIKIGDALPDQLYISDTKENIKPEGAKKSRRVYAGDLILSNSMSFGRPYILKVDGCIHDGWLLIRDEEKRFDKRFLCFYLAADSTLAQYKKFAAGSCVNNLNSELVASVEIGIPPLEHQIYVANILEKMDKQVETATTMYALLNKVREALSRQLFI